MAFSGVLIYGVWGIAVVTLTYPVFVALLAIPAVQDQVIYLNAVKMTWGQDLLLPEQWGFLHNQVTPFWLQTLDGEILLAWHILPLEFYLKYEDALNQEPSGVVEDITKTLAFRLLRDDSEAKLVLYFHGAAGSLGSGYRPPSYHAISAASTKDVHIIAVDYRGYGLSSGKPSEDGLMIDARTVVDFATTTAKISSNRIVLFGQSLGTAVCIKLAATLAAQSTPVLFAGMVLVAPFANVEKLTSSYRIAGTIPLLDPLARFPGIMALLNSFIRSKWDSQDHVQKLIRRIDELGATYHISFIHGQDDYDIPFTHSKILFEHAVNASIPSSDSSEAIHHKIQQSRRELGAGGYGLSYAQDRSTISLNILKYGLHDKIMGYPVVSRAIIRAFSQEQAG